ncbi:hypothetical protein JAAARDRAFT_145274 [Jaapia argillacea MUCL 33604]|uniref:Uncharacterized protein n=1 Tax=Jaapia argillacea MUCL 33604 TaxID=933084 RepID=A0A067QLW7_9AGAM|nr:hypothetical protein JAAARDRAFT_145274 [Jaapia argillacea MUCL 33604]
MLSSSTILLLMVAASLAQAAHSPPLVVQEPFSTISDVKVPVVLGVMSRCPDALMCESVFDRVVHRVADKINLTMTYLGKINSSESTFGVTCMHGQDECAGNVHQLCVAKYTQLSQWWEFVQCNNYHGRDKIGTPEVALSCAKTTEIDWEGSGAGQCAGIDGSGTGEEGISLLRESVKNTQALNITQVEWKSCTIVINGNQVCIRDDGQWKSCEAGHAPADFIKQIDEEYNRLNSNETGDEFE